GRAAEAEDQSKTEGESPSPPLHPGPESGAVPQLWREEALASRLSHLRCLPRAAGDPDPGAAQGGV
ncbi:MAG: hypothetical protein AVDCRST_MAG59-2429, partial [uncultured Thermomicrobiales bacterium]